MNNEINEIKIELFDDDEPDISLNLFISTLAPRYDQRIFETAPRHTATPRSVDDILKLADLYRTQRGENTITLDMVRLSIYNLYGVHVLYWDKN